MAGFAFRPERFRTCRTVNCLYPILGEEMTTIGRFISQIWMIVLYSMPHLHGQSKAYIPVHCPIQ